MGSDKNEVESKRDRVRRLVLDPLAERGFRFPRAVPNGDQRKALDALADALTYMSDGGLRAVEEALRTKGEGSARCFWPCQATVLGISEAIEKRPLEEMPGLLRWFASRAGPESLRLGQHVAEYLFWKRHKRPPVSDRDRARVAEDARMMAEKALRVRDRIERGLPPFADDGQWLGWYDALDARVRDLIATREDAA